MPIGLSPAAFKLHELASRERRTNEAGEDYFSTPVDRVLEECGIALSELTGIVCELEIGQLCEFKETVQGVIVLRVIKPTRCMSPANRFQEAQP